MLYRQRAEIRGAEGRPDETVNLLRAALEAAEEWRAEVSPTDALQSSSAGSLHQLYQEFVDASLRLPHPLVVEAFEAAEKDRAARLRSVLMSAPGWRRSVPAQS